MQPPTLMNLKVLLPFRIFAEKTGVSRIVAETQEGSFGLLPHRLDCVAALAPGILIYENEAEGEVYVAVDEGVLVKTGLDVFVSVRNAIAGTDLGQLREAVEREFLNLNEREQGVRSVMAKMESGFIRRLVSFTMSEKSQNRRTRSRTAAQSGGRFEGGAQAQARGVTHTHGLVWLGHDGAYRLVGGRSDAARRGVGSLAGQPPSGKSIPGR
jgi:F-type H+-transporting ATPase subunit epsilon